jgi:hypothetical protein
MPGRVVVPDVVLCDADLNWSEAPWPSVSAANQQRLLPIIAGFLVSSAALSFVTEPTLIQLVLMAGPIALGFWGYLWMTGGHYLSSYKKAYQATPTGAAPCQFVFDANGVHQVGPHHESRLDWSAFVEVAESGDGFRFWMTPFMAIVLPMRFVTPPQAEEIRALIIEARADGRIKGVSGGAASP